MLLSTYHAKGNEMSHEHFFYYASLCTIAGALALLGWVELFFAAGSFYHVGIMNRAPSIGARLAGVVAGISCFWASAWVFMYVAP